MEKQGDQVAVFRGTAMEAQLIRGLLADAGIEAFVEGENMGTLLPAAASAAGVRPVEVVVRAADGERARQELDRALHRDETTTEEGFEFSAT